MTEMERFHISYTKDSYCNEDLTVDTGHDRGSGARGWEQAGNGRDFLQKETVWDLPYAIEVLALSLFLVWVPGRNGNIESGEENTGCNQIPFLLRHS
jgi:hypothetical protein